MAGIDRIAGASGRRRWEERDSHPLQSLLVRELLFGKRTVEALSLPIAVSKVSRMVSSQKLANLAHKEACRNLLLRQALQCGGHGIRTHNPLRGI
jgi:hypothetical protein